MKFTDSNLWFSVYCCLYVFDFIRQIIIRKAQQWQIISASFRLWTDIVNFIIFAGKMYQLILQMKHLVDEKTCNAPKSSDLLCIWLKYRSPCLFFPTLSHEACSQSSERPVCALSPPRSLTMWLLSEHDDVIKWEHFRVTGPLCGEFTGHR